MSNLTERVNHWMTVAQDIKVRFHYEKVSGKWYWVHNADDLAELPDQQFETFIDCLRDAVEPYVDDIELEDDSDDRRGEYVDAPSDANMTVTIAETIEERRVYKVAADSAEEGARIAHNLWINEGVEQSPMSLSVVERDYIVETACGFAYFDTDLLEESENDDE